MGRQSATFLCIKVACVLAISAAASKHSVADTRTPVVELGPKTVLKVGPGMHATGTDMRDSIFVGQDLSGASFDNCDLDRVTLVDCRLDGVSFRNAKLTGLRTEDCSIVGANFSDAIINGILKGNGLAGQHGMKLTESQIISTASYKQKDLSDCVVAGDPSQSKLDFRGVNLRRSFLIDGDFSQVDFADANIFRVTFYSCVLSEDNLKVTRQYKQGAFRDMGFISVRFVDNVDMFKINLSGSELGWAGRVELDGADISACTIGGFSVSADQLKTTKNYREGNLTSINFRRFNLSNVDLSNQNLTNSSFVLCDLTGANLENSVLTNADLRHAKGLAAEQVEKSWNYRNRRMDTIKLPKDLGLGG